MIRSTHTVSSSTIAAVVPRPQQSDLKRVSSLSESQTSEIRHLLKQESSNITKKTSDLVERYFNGKHRTVLALKKYPGLVIKIIHGSNNTKDLLMNESMQKARELVQSKKLQHIFIPDAVYIPSDNSFSDGVWIEEKLNGTIDYIQAEDESIREYAQFSTHPELKEKWVKFFRQAAIFIKESGYSDVDWRNLIKMENGIGFCDFEGVDFSKDKASAISGGLSRLIEMSPPEAIQAIDDVMEKESVKSAVYKSLSRYSKYKGMPKAPEERVTFIENVRKQEVEQRAFILKKFDSVPMQKGSRLKVDRYEAGTIQHQILTLYNNNIDAREKYMNTEYFNYLRCLQVQPFLMNKHNEAFNGCAYPTQEDSPQSALEKRKKHPKIWKNKELAEEKIQIFIAALEGLVKEGVIQHFEFIKTDIDLACSKLKLYA